MRSKAERREERIAIQAEVDRLLTLTPFPVWTIREMLADGRDPLVEMGKIPDPNMVKLDQSISPLDIKPVH